MTDEQIEKGLYDMIFSFNWGSVDRVIGINPYGNVPKNVEIVGEALAYINRLKAEKAVSDRALELALSAMFDLIMVLEIPQIYSRDEFIGLVSGNLRHKAKQELEKEKANAENKG